MKTVSINLTLSLLLALSLVCPARLMAQFNSVYAMAIEPEQPTVADSVIITVEFVFAAMGRDQDSITVQTDDNSFMIRAYYSEHDVQLMMSYGIKANIGLGELDTDNYLVRAFLFNRVWGDEDYALDDSMDFEFQVSNQALQLAEGWNLISGAFSPNNDDVENLFAGLVERGSLIMVKDIAGNFYYPAREFNNIRYWDGLQGYYVDMAQADVLHLNGERIAPDTPLSLQAGWSAVAYLLEDTVAAPDAFRSIEDALKIAKNGAGEFYMPGSFNNMSALRPGQGYQVRLSAAAELIWGAR